MLILIGSAALVNHGIQTGRPSLDIDVVGSYDDIIEYAKTRGNIKECYPVKGGDKLVIKTDQIIIEGEITWDNSSAADLWNAVSNDPDTLYEKRLNGFIHPSLNMLYTLKMSHRYLKNSPHFLKTMRDIQLMRRNGATITDALHPFYLRRMAATYTYKHPSLMQSKKDFFSDDGIKYQFDHDSIHEAVKHMERPAYTYFKPENSPVMCDKDMFFAADEKIRLYAVLEESYVLALERSQIPFPNLLPPKKSFDIALMKVCSSITSGYFREFAWEHYDYVQEMYNDNYVERFKACVEAGIVVPHNPEKAVY